MGYDIQDCDLLVQNVVFAIDDFLLDHNVRIRRLDSIFSTADLFPTENEKHLTQTIRWFLRGIFITINDETLFELVWKGIEKEYNNSPALGWMRAERSKLAIEQIEVPVDEDEGPFYIFWDDFSND